MAAFMFGLGLLLCFVAVGSVAFGLKLPCIALSFIGVMTMLYGYGRAVRTEGKVYS